MHHEDDGSHDSALRRLLINPLLVLASLYSLYLVLHPYTPLSKLNISILDLTQVQRATHVFLLLSAGYLLSSQRKLAKAGVGSLVFAGLSLLPLLAFWQLDLAPTHLAAGTLFWLVAVTPTLWPPSNAWVDKAAALMSLAPFLYQVILFHEIIDRAMLPEPWDLVMGFGLTMLLLGQVFRYTGAILPCQIGRAHV
jgi:TRAP-type uncharacterized transport system fused permease subunit